MWDLNPGRLRGKLTLKPLGQLATRHLLLYIRRSSEILLI